MSRNAADPIWRRGALMSVKRTGASRRATFDFVV